jgi:hypothetical protein
MTRQDQNVEIARYQKEIAVRLGLDSDNLIFNYKQKNETIRLDLVTVNPKHEQSFLFHTITGTDTIDALKKMLEYIDEHYPNESSMTIQWVKIGDNKLHTPISVLRICTVLWINSITVATSANTKSSAFR